MNSSSGTTSKGKKTKGDSYQLQRSVRKSLEEKGYAEFWNHKFQAFANRTAISGKQFLTQLPVGTTIYDKPRKCDFFIINREKFSKGLIIECKWQESKGSVDEKYPFLIFNIVKTAIPTVIVIDGGGYNSAAIEWLKDQADPKRSLIHVWSLDEFQKAVKAGFLG